MSHLKGDNGIEVVFPVRRTSHGRVGGIGVDYIPAELRILFGVRVEIVAPVRETRLPSVDADRALEGLATDGITEAGVCAESGRPVRRDAHLDLVWTPS